jgi:PIN domain nuclease of toxin-antitoxin system
MMVLDTHAWIWWVASQSKLSKRARAAVAAEAELGVCVVSCWEVAMLVEKGRIGFDRDVERWVHEALNRPRVVALDLTAEIAVAAARLAGGFHGDPVDRMITATALRLDCAVVTKDRKLRAYAPLRTVW